MMAFCSVETAEIADHGLIHMHDVCGVSVELKEKSIMPLETKPLISLDNMHSPSCSKTVLSLRDLNHSSVMKEWPVS